MGGIRWDAFLTLTMNLDVSSALVASLTLRCVHCDPQIRLHRWLPIRSDPDLAICHLLYIMFQDTKKKCKKKEHRSYKYTCCVWLDINWEINRERIWFLLNKFIKFTRDHHVASWCIEYYAITCATSQAILLDDRLDDKWYLHQWQALHLRGSKVWHLVKPSRGHYERNYPFSSFSSSSELSDP